MGVAAYGFAAAPHARKPRAGQDTVRRTVIEWRNPVKPTHIGEFEICRVADFCGPSFDPAEFFPDFDPEVVRENAALLGPQLIDPASGKLVFSFHSFVVKTPRHTILIDSCIGNGKDRAARPQWHKMRTSYLADLAAVGVKPEQVDYVMCTHLHWDHVGWNTRLVDGSWVPTFPNARYIMAKREFGHWQGVHDRGDATPHVTAFADSILPVVKSGQSLLVDDDYALDDTFTLTPTPGHSPCHCCVNIRSRGQRAVVVGDLMHHALQVREPDWSTVFDWDQKEAARSRRGFFGKVAGTGSYVLPIHFPHPTTGQIEADGDRFRYKFVR
jgi:glyoxylase-like metal-dependent hydrolase (beta-lactamase superfamily II)